MHRIRRIYQVIPVLVVLGLLHHDAPGAKPTAAAPEILAAEVGTGLDIPVEKLSFQAANQARGTFRFSAKKDGQAGQMLVTKSNGQGYVTLGSPYIKIQPNTTYKVTLRLRTIDFSYASFVSLMIPEYENVTTRPLAPHPQTYPEFAALLPCREGEWIPRYCTFISKPTARFVRITLVIKGNPVQLAIGQVRIEPAAKKENRPAQPHPPAKLVDLGTVNRRLAERPMASAKVVREDGRMKLMISNQETVPVAFHGMFWDPTSAAANLDDQMARAGVPVHVAWINLGPYCMAEGSKKLTPSVWVGHQQYEFSKLDQVIEGVLRADPNAYVIVGLLMTPYQTWGDRYPEEVIRNEKGEKGVGSYVHNIAYRNQLTDTTKEYWCPSLCSQVYRREACDAAVALVTHLKTTPLYKSVIGFMLGGGDDGQWGPWERSGMLNMGDYSPAGLRAFRAWLSEKYKTPEKLQAAWGKSDVDFLTAQIPSVKERMGEGKVFLDPAQDQSAIDYFRFNCEEKCRTIVYFAEGIKKAAGKDIVVGTWYEDALYGRRNNLWAEAIRQRSPYLDFFTSPVDYGLYRRAGWAGGNGVVLNSLALHNKLFLDELDLRTGVSSYISDTYDYDVIGRLENAEDFNAVNRREAGIMACYGMGVRYYAMAGGSFYAPYAQAGVTEMSKLYSRIIERQPQAFTPDVAVFADEDSAPYLSQLFFDKIIFPSTSQTRSALFLSGVPFDIYGTQDLMDARLPEYKVYVFLNSYFLNQAQRTFIHDRLQKANKTLVWVHAAGLFDEKSRSIDNLRKIVGMNVRVDPTVQDLNVVSLRGNSAGLRNLSPFQGAAAVATVGWKFSIADSNVSALAKYETGGQVAVGVRKFDSWTSVYIAKPGGLGPDLLNRIARAAGAFTITDEGNLAAMNGNLMVLHGVKGGEQTVTLPFQADVVDLISQKEIAHAATQFRVKIPVKETLLLELKACSKSPSSGL